MVWVCGDAAHTGYGNVCGTDKIRINGEDAYRLPRLTIAFDDEDLIYNFAELLQSDLEQVKLGFSRSV